MGSEHVARRRTTRAGDRWQPGAGGRTRRRRVGVPRLTRRTGRLLALVIVLAGLSVGGWWFYNSPLLSIDEVTVEGTSVLSPEAVLGIAGLEGQSLLTPDFDGARQRLLALPIVKDVEIGRTWPNGVKITVVERTPWGVWQAGAARSVIDDEGFVLEGLAPEGAPVIVQVDTAAPLVPGDRVDEGAVAVARPLVPMAERTLGLAVVSLEFSQESGLLAVLGDADGAVVRATFGDDQGYDFKIATLYTLLKRGEDEGRTLRQVDLRFGDRVALRWGAAQ